MELVADAPRRKPTYVARFAAFKNCPRKRGAQTAGLPSVRRRSLGMATTLIQRVVCRSRRGCSAAHPAMLQTYSAKVRLLDLARPQVRILGGGLASGRWVSGAQGVTFTATDNIGIASQRVVVRGKQIAGLARPCNPARPIPCPNGPGQLGLDTRRLTNGPQALTVQALDSAGNGQAASTIALVDNAPPDRVEAQLEGGEGWRRTNGYTIRWANPREPHAPIAAALYRLCRTGTATCSVGRRTGAGIDRIAGLAAPGAGDWSLEVWRQDAAGNAHPGYASSPIRVRFDPEPPRLGFDPQSLANPARVSVLVTDTVSGMGGGEIELRRRGSTAWQVLPTLVEGTRLVARIDDARLPAGSYELRARAVDRAGNESSTHLRLDGAPMVLSLPLRFEAVMSAGIRRVRVMRRVGRRGGRRRVLKRRVVRLHSQARVSYGRRVRVQGTLTNPDGQPLASARIYVLSSAGGSEALAGVVTTNASGAYSYVARASSSRALLFRYLGTELVRPTERAVELVVPAASTLNASRRRARNGQTVLFSGRLRTRPVPPTGKLVEIQAHFRRRWRTFSTVRTDRGGRWRFPYRFGGTSGVVRYRFRARVPEESGYPFATGRSRVARITVRGP